jgi:hypothetical protein
MLPAFQPTLHCLRQIGSCPGFSGDIQSYNMGTQRNRRNHPFAFLFYNSGNITVFTSFTRRNFFKHQFAFTRQALGIFIITLLYPARHTVSY